MATHRSVFCVFADDIRQEIGNKMTLVGVYQGGMNVSGVPPQALSKLGISIFVQCPHELPFSKMAMDLVMGDEVLQHVEPSLAPDQLEAISKPTHPESTGIGLNVVIVLQPFVVSRDGILRVKVKLDEEEMVSNGLFIKFVERSESVAAASPETALSTT